MYIYTCTCHTMLVIYTCNTCTLRNGDHGFLPTWLNELSSQGCPHTSGGGFAHTLDWGPLDWPSLHTELYTCTYQRKYIASKGNHSADPTCTCTCTDVSLQQRNVDDTEKRAGSRDYVIATLTLHNDLSCTVCTGIRTRSRSSMKTCATPNRWTQNIRAPFYYHHHKMDEEIVIQY